MSGHLTQLREKREGIGSSAELVSQLRSVDLSAASVTLVGLGNMGKQYLSALEALSIRRIRVIGRSTESLEMLKERPEIVKISGGFEQASFKPDPEELGIIAVPTQLLMPAARHLASLGFRKLLIEKPVALRSVEISALVEELRRQEVLAVTAYNRVAYPSFLECRSRAEREGGITSCTYTFTELISSDWEWIFPPEELARWGLSNSLHPIGMAHRLIGPAREWTGYRKGGLSWHPAGSIFVGSGQSDRGIPFSYQADWGSTGRWSVEVHTPFSSYRLCPLERLFRRVEARGDWVEVPLSTFDPKVKAGLVEQVAAILHPEIRQRIPLVSLEETAELARYGEKVFGYEN